MARAHTHEADSNSPVRRCSDALLLLAITGLLVACGGGGSEQTSAPGGGGGGGVVTGCATGPAPAVLIWDAVTDPDLAGYRIYYGTAPGMYLQAAGSGVDVGNVTTTPVMGLSSGTTYYFAATAYSTSSPPNESIFSNEVCKTIS